MVESTNDLAEILQTIHSAAAAGDADAIFALNAITSVVQEYNLKKLEQPAEANTVAILAPELSLAAANVTDTGGQGAIAASVAAPEMSAAVGAVVPSESSAAPQSARSVDELLKVLGLSQKTAPNLAI